MGWLKVWDTALDHGPPGTITVLTVLKLLSKTVFVDRQCNMEGCDFVIAPNVPCFEHFLSQHTDLNIDSLLSQIYSCSEELFQTGLELSKFVWIMFCTLFLLFFTRANSLPCVYIYFYPFPSLLGALIMKLWLIVYITTTHEALGALLATVTENWPAKHCNREVSSVSPWLYMLIVRR